MQSFLPVVEELASNLVQVGEEIRLSPQACATFVRLVQPGVPGDLGPLQQLVVLAVRVRQRGLEGMATQMEELVSQILGPEIAEEHAAKVWQAGNADRGDGRQKPAGISKPMAGGVSLTQKRKRT
jgi:hypothetical protein